MCMGSVYLGLQHTHLFSQMAKKKSNCPLKKYTLSIESSRQIKSIYEQDSTFAVTFQSQCLFSSESKEYKLIPLNIFKCVFQMGYFCLQIWPSNLPRPSKYKSK